MSNVHERTADELREHRIREHRRKLLAATSATEKEGHWIAMVQEINARSPEQIERMEIERGLR